VKFVYILPVSDQQDFTVSTTSTAGGTVVSLAGELDLLAEERAARALREADAGDPPVLIVDLSGLGFIDSTGVRLLIDADRRTRARGRGRRLVLVRGNPQNQPLLSISGIDGYLETVDRLEDVAEFAPHAVRETA
jgi:anti-sigma B factor antagonist